MRTLAYDKITQYSRNRGFRYMKLIIKYLKTNATHKLIISEGLNIYNIKIRASMSTLTSINSQSSRSPGH